MSDMHTYSSDVAFTPAVKAIQTRKGSRDGLCPASSRTAAGAPRSTKTSRPSWPRPTASILATATADGQPYIQHRGGPKGFVKILDKDTLAFADYSGNRQYITQGNLSENPKALHLHHGLCASPPREDLGRGARGGGRSGAD